MVKIDFKLVREKSVEVFWSYSHFRKKKKIVLNIIPYLKRFNYTYKKFFIKDAKNFRNGEIFPIEKRGSKT